MPDQIFPEPTVGVFIFNQAGELLLLKSHKWFDKYVVPGGHVELGERLEEAAIREAKEETGLDVHGLEFICHQEFIHDPAFWHFGKDVISSSSTTSRKRILSKCR
jgi:nucleoside triphosphatase